MRWKDAGCQMSVEVLSDATRRRSRTQQSWTPADATSGAGLRASHDQRAQEAHLGPLGADHSAGVADFVDVDVCAVTHHNVVPDVVDEVALRLRIMGQRTASPRGSWPRSWPDWPIA